MSTYTTYSDEYLLLLLQESDQRAFKAIYERYWERLFVTACPRLNSPVEAEELVQDVFLNLWRKRIDLQLRHTLNTYLATAVKYEVINRLAKPAFRTTSITEENSMHVAVNNTDDRLFLTDLQSRLASLVKALPEKCRLVFTLSREQGYSQRQIARQLNISENTVESHMKHALKSLRTGLQQFLSLFL